MGYIMTVNIIGIGAIAAVTNINLVLEAMGRGPNSLSRPATTNPAPTWETAPTHKYMSDQGVTGEFAAILLGFANGDLPPLPPGTVWGEEGVISAADALAAITSENFAFASFNEAFTPGEQVAAALDALGLVIVPDPPL
jgi:hypothetical protein